MQNKLTSTKRIRNAEKCTILTILRKLKVIQENRGLLKSMINNDVSKTDSIKGLRIDNAICTDSKKIADKFNDFL